MSLIIRSVGCMIGAAYGDSLGAAVEFFSLAHIRSIFGSGGISVCRPAFGQPAGCITDDTQMADATANGLLATASDDQEVVCNVYREYLKWYESQCEPGFSRGPGSTCLSALGSGAMGTVERPLNHSAGCGGIMRVHPVGLWADDNQRAFDMGVATAAITHGAPNGYLSSGAFAVIIHSLTRGATFEESVANTVPFLKGYGQLAGDTLESIEIAMNSAVELDVASQIDREIGQMGRYGGGWYGHDALAIALFAFRTATDPVQIVVNAVNHSGDSDSTGSLAGAMIGAVYGAEPFENTLRQSGVELELHDELSIAGKRLICT